jgi:hypothetical protein
MSSRSRRVAPRAHQGEVAPIAIRGAERSQVGQPERDDRARHGQHDVQRLGVERVRQTTQLRDRVPRHITSRIGEPSVAVERGTQSGLFDRWGESPCKTA